MVAALLSTLAFGIDVPRVDVPPVVDGVLDDPAWALAEPITDFVEFAPTAGGRPPGPTDVRFVHDDDRLYIAVSMEHARPVRYRWAPREDLNQDDQIGVLIDTFGQGHAGYVLYFNPIGIQQDIRVNSGRWSFEWDAIMDAVGRVADSGTAWTLEVSIPFSSIKYPSTHGEQAWGLVLHRIDVADLRRSSWPVTERGQAALWEDAAPLVLTPPRRGSGFEIIPSLTAIQQGTAADGPMTWTGVTRPLDAFRPSLDVRFGITPNIGVTGTINPDFSQVENDETPLDLNRRFAFYFPEQRPFFLDGADLFQDDVGLLYTRSIVEPVGGLKVAGKEGPVTVGLLHALDRSPAPSVHERGAPGFDPGDLDGAWTANTVARVTAEAFGDGQIGISFADKRVLGDGAGWHDAGLVDAFVPLPNRWIATGTVLGSATGDARDRLLGAGFTGSVARQSGIGTGGSLAITATQPGLRLETGFTNQTGFVRAEAAIDHTVTPATGVDTARPQLEASLFREVDGDGWGYVGGGLECETGPSNFGAWGGAARTWERGVSVNGGQFGGWLWTRPTGWLKLSPEASWSHGLDYQRLAPADQAAIDGRVTLWPARHVRLDTSLGLRWLVPAHDDVERSMRLRSKLGYQFSRTLGARLIGEYTAGAEVAHRLVSSALLTWLVHPGTGVWVGYAESAGLDGHYTATERTAFAKISVLLRPPRLQGRSTEVALLDDALEPHHRRLTPRGAVGIP